MNQKTAKLIRRYARANQLAYRSAKAWFITEPRPRRHWLKTSCAITSAFPLPGRRIPQATFFIMSRKPKPITPSQKRLLRACNRLIEIVEGTGSVRWSVDGMRLKDSNEWVEFYVAWCDLNRQPNPR